MGLSRTEYLSWACQSDIPYLHGLVEVDLPGGKDVEIANIATKPSSSYDGLVARLSISTNMLHEPDLSAAISGTIVCPRARGHYSQGI